MVPYFCPIFRGPGLDGRVAQVIRGCPTHRALCDVWVLATDGMRPDHNQTSAARSAELLAPEESMSELTHASPTHSQSTRMCGAPGNLRKGWVTEDMTEESSSPSNEEWPQSFNSGKREVATRILARLTASTAISCATWARGVMAAH